MSTFLKAFLVLGIMFSITVTYYSKMIIGDYVVFSNPDGIPTLEE